MEGYVRKICAVIRRFRILSVLKRKKKVAAFPATLPLAGFVGSESKITAALLWFS